MLNKIKIAESLAVYIYCVTLKKAADLHWNVTHYFAFVLVALRKRGRKRPISVWETQDGY